jgi:hypothetical protein
MTATFCTAIVETFGTDSFIPRIVRVSTDGTYSDVTTLNFLALAQTANPEVSFLSTDVFFVSYNSGANFGIFTDVISGNNITLIPSSQQNVGSLIPFNVTVGQSSLASAGNVKLITAQSATAQYRVFSLFLNSGGTNFSGGGGDRLGQVTDATTVYSVIPATNMQTLLNAGWGISTPLPFPVSAPIDTLTAAGIGLLFKYSGGATDYTTGSLVMSGIVQLVTA